MTETNWDERYRTGDLPWDSGRPDRHLEQVLDEFAIGPCAALEAGCGTGTNAVWLARQGFRVTAVDVAPTAIAEAGRKAASAGVAVAFVAGDFLHVAIPGGPFGFLFDRGCLHSFDTRAERVAFADRAAGLLDEGGLWFSVIGSADAEPRDVGPPRLSASEVTSIVEGRFEVLSLRASHFDSDSDHKPAAWLCVMRKRRQRGEPSE